ncbi:MAG: hypothetical protein BMS9Abin11_1585 [Gammaproteobacteria bacterium]|nr:MAG: hypothetical protein BMS9Abin11_1585 [Gammaproteobacteria bacterium]
MNVLATNLEYRDEILRLQKELAKQQDIVNKQQDIIDKLIAALNNALCHGKWKDYEAMVNSYKEGIALLNEYGG